MMPPPFNEKQKNLSWKIQKLSQQKNLKFLGAALRRAFCAWTNNIWPDFPNLTPDRGF